MNNAYGIYHIFCYYGDGHGCYGTGQHGLPSGCGVGVSYGYNYADGVGCGSGERVGGSYGYRCKSSFGKLTRLENDIGII